MCGRASRSSAAAEPARPLRRLALALAFFSTMPDVALSKGLVLPALLPPSLQSLTCDNIPPPFGVGRDASLPGFAVKCGLNREAMLQIGGDSYRIEQVDLSEGFIIIFAGPIRQVCYDRNGKQSQTNGSVASMNLVGTPFSFSSNNKLVATGCNYTLAANFDRVRPTSCSTLCSGSSNTIINGSCLGRACCKTDIPMDGAHEFNFTFQRTPGQVTSEEDDTCSAAFFLYQDDQVFTDGHDRPLKDALMPLGQRRMALNWALQLMTCEQARSYNFAPQYYCNNLSECVDTRSGAGHLCRCKAGYYGNPYAAGGCRDINECRDAKYNNCSKVCNNTAGGFTCSCPQGMIGDGYREGTGCSDSILPSGLPGPTPKQSQGTNVCIHPEMNPCTHPKHCFYGDGTTLCTCPDGMDGNGEKKGSGCKRHFPMVIALGVGLALMVTATITSVCYYWTMKKRELGRKRAELFRKNGGLLLQQRFSVNTSQGEDSSAKIFSAEELKSATNNYDECRILGRGGQGTVYKGVLPNKAVIAIKKSILHDESQVEQFVNEITILSQIDHPNVVKLLGCCLETQVPLLVYEFIPNGTLFQHIHNRSACHSLTWEDCLRIAAETAQALAHLHSTSSIPIIHRDIKSSNILLDENFVAKISDFGASRSVPFDQTHVTTLIQGTIGYLDPEYFQSSRLTERSDVYSFGVVLAELLTRKKPITVGGPEESCNLAMYLVTLFNEGRLLQEIEPHILAEAGEEQLHTVAQLSVRCLNLNGDERPNMEEVASVLHGLRMSFTQEQTIRSKQESVRKNDEQDQLHREARPTSSLQSSEESMQHSMEAAIQPSSHMPR